MDAKRLAIFCGTTMMLLPFILTLPCSAQQTPQQIQSTADSSSGAALNEVEARSARLELEMQAVMTALSETRRQLDDSHQQIEELRHELSSLSAKLPDNSQATSTEAVNQPASDLREAVTQLQESDEILQSEITQHEQTKVESISKYPVKISGLVLFTSSLNNGTVDNVDLPTIAIPQTPYTARASLTATTRQSIFGLDAKGPQLWGAQSAADFRLDLFGGFPTDGYESSAGTIRMRTAHFKLAWQQTSVVASFDTPLISPLQPASFLTVGQPALAWSGNLWTWAPQLAVNHRFRAASEGGAEVEFGLIDPAVPRFPNSGLIREPTAGESSRQPGYETRVQYGFGAGNHLAIFGVGGYYARQHYSGSNNVDAWAGTADWRVPVGTHLEASGEIYRGRAIGGLGGGAFKDYVITTTAGQVSGFDAIGGWTQIKARLTSSLEANGAAGQDNGFAGELRYSNQLPGAGVYSGLVRNRTILGNVIYRPRAYLLLSAEYRNIHSWQIVGPPSQANIVGLSAGYLF